MVDKVNIGFLFFIGLFAGVFLLSTYGTQPIRTEILDEYCILKYGNESYYIDDQVFGVDIEIECYGTIMIRKRILNKSDAVHAKVETEDQDE